MPGEPTRQPSSVNAPTPSERAEAAEVLSGLQRVMSGAALFTLDHPAVKAAAAACASQADRVGRNGPLSVTVIPSGFSLAGESLERTEPLEELAARLSALLVVGLRFEPALTGEEVAAWCDCIVRAGKERPSPAELARRTSQASGAKIHATVLQTDRLSFGDGVREAASGSETTWDQLAAFLVGGVGDSPVAAGDATAPNELRAAIEGADPASLGALRDRLGGLTGRLEPNDWRRAQLVDERIAEFVSSLSGGVREALVRADVADPAAAMRFLAHYGEKLPTAEVLTALESIGASANAATPEALRLFGVLARSRAGTGEELAAFGRVLGRLMDPGPAGTQDGVAIDAELRDSLEDILQAGGSDRFTPEDYRRVLDRASRGLRAAAAAVGAFRYEAGDAALHAAEVAAALASDESEPATPGMLSKFERGIDDLIAARRLDLLAGGVRAGRRAIASGSAPSKAASERAIAALCVPERVASALAITDADPEDIATVASVAGPGALRALLVRTASVPGIELAALRPLLAPVDTAGRIALLAELAPRNVDAAVTLVRLVAAESLSVAAPVLEAAVKSPEARLRREGYLGLTRGGVAWTERLAQSAINDDDAATRAAGIDGLCRDQSAWSSTLLAGFLAGRLGPVHPEREAFGRAAKALAERGEQAREMASAVLDFLAWRIGSARARLADTLAAALERFKSERAVRRSIARWRRSPARLVVRLQGSSGDEKGRAAA